MFAKWHSILRAVRDRGFWQHHSTVSHTDSLEQALLAARAISSSILSVSMSRSFILVTSTIATDGTPGRGHVLSPARTRAGTEGSLAVVAVSNICHDSILWRNKCSAPTCAAVLSQRSRNSGSNHQLDVWRRLVRVIGMNCFRCGLCTSGWILPRPVFSEATSSEMVSGSGPRRYPDYRQKCVAAQFEGCEIAPKLRVDASIWRVPIWGVI